MKFGDRKIYINGQENRADQQNKVTLPDDINRALERLAGSIGMTVAEMCKIAIKMKEGK